MDSMRAMISRADGAGFFSKGIRDGASEGSGPSGVFGDPPHVKGRARVSTRVRGTASDGRRDGDGFPLPPPFETATRGPERVSPRVPGPLGGGGQEVPPQEQRTYDGQARRARPVGLPYTSPQVSGVGVPQGALEGHAFSAALRDSLDAFISFLHERLSFLETACGVSRRSRRRRRRLSSSSSDSEHSGGDGGRHVPRRAVGRALGRELEGNRPCRLPERITPADDRYAAILDCVSYALANTDVRYDRTMAHGLGRLRKDVSATFGRDAECDGTPALGVFEFLNRSVKTGNDNDMSEVRALYPLPEFTKGDPNRRCTQSCRPSKDGGVESSVPIWNWSTGSSANMRTSSR